MSYGAGGEKWTWTIANYLKYKGYKVEIYALPYAPHGRRVVKPEKVLDNIPYHESWIHNVDADIAYIFYNPLAYIPFRCNSLKIAGIHTNVYFLPKSPPITYGGAAVFSRFLYKAIGRFDLSLYDAVHLVNKGANVRHKKVFNISNFVDTDKYKPLTSKFDRFTVLFCGRPIWQKGWDIFLKTAILSKKKHNNVDFAWVGGYDEKIRKYVRCLGYVSTDEQMADIYSSSHLVLQPSRSEGGYPPLSILESLACGTPAIVTPLKIYHGIELPLIYASTTEDILRKISEIRRNWVNGTYDELSRKCRSRVGIFAKKTVLPKIENMFIEMNKSV